MQSGVCGRPQCRYSLIYAAEAGLPASRSRGPAMLGGSCEGNGVGRLQVLDYASYNKGSAAGQVPYLGSESKR